MPTSKPGNNRLQTLKNNMKLFLFYNYMATANNQQTINPIKMETGLHYITYAYKYETISFFSSNNVK